MYKECNLLFLGTRNKLVPKKPFLIQDSIATSQNDGIPYFYKE